MKLKNQKPSKNFRDRSWLPVYDDSWQNEFDFVNNIVRGSLRRFPGDPLGKQDEDRAKEEHKFNLRFPQKFKPVTEGGDSSLAGQPYGSLSPDEILMLRSGADLRELLFMRAMQNRGQPGYLTPRGGMKR